jgi:hypothetical protein
MNVRLIEHTNIKLNLRQAGRIQQFSDCTHQLRRPRPPRKHWDLLSILQPFVGEIENISYLLPVLVRRRPDLRPLA